MSPLYIKMRPEDNVTVDVRDLTASESLIMLDYASNSRTDSSASVVQHNTVAEHDNDDDTQPVCDSLQPSSSNELYDNSEVVSDSNEMCNPETSFQSVKTHSITDSSEHEIKYSDIIDHCDTSQSISSVRSSECGDLKLTGPQNIPACSLPSPDSSTPVDKSEKSVLNKKKLAEVPKKKPETKSKFNINNFVKTTVSKQFFVIQQLAEQSTITANTWRNVDAKKEMRNFKNRTTKSKRKDGKVQEPSKTKLLPNKEQNILEGTTERRKKKVTKSVLKLGMNSDKNEDKDSRTEHTEEKSSRMSHSKRKSILKLKHKRNSIESDDSMKPTVPVNDNKNNRRTKQKTEPKLWKRILSNHVSTKKSRKHITDSTSDEEEISVESKLPIDYSTTEASSKLDGNNDALKKTDKEDIDNLDEKTILNKKIKLAENRQTPVSTEHFVVQSNLTDMKQNSELEDLKPKLPSLPVTINTEKLKCMPKLFEKCNTNLNHNEFVDQKNSTIKHVELSENWNVHPLNAIPQTTKTLQQRWAEVGLIAPVDEKFYLELKRKSQLGLQETSSFDNQGMAMVNPLATLSASITEYSSSYGEKKQCKCDLTVHGTVKLPVQAEIKSHEMIQPKRQINFDPSKETTIAHESFASDGKTKIMPRTETRACNNYAMQVDFPTQFLVPSVPPRKRIRVTTNVEEQTLPLKTNIDSDKDDEEIGNSSGECCARNKHSFKFVTSTGTKRMQKVKITRPDMSHIVTRKPFEDDSISIYADSLCTDTMSVRNDCDLDDTDDEISPSKRNDIVSEWIRHSQGHSTVNATPENTQIEEETRTVENPMFAEDEASNRVVDTNRPYNLDTLYIFNGICRYVLKRGICLKYKCIFKHALPTNWEITLQNMPKESLQNLYNNVKNRMYLYLLKKMFPVVVQQFVEHRDFNSVIGLVKDVLEIYMDADQTLYINVIINAMRGIGMTFNSIVDVIFNSMCKIGNLKDQLTDLLLNICMEQDDIANRWSTIQVLMKYRNYHVDDDIIETILSQCLIKNTLQKELCLKVYSDLIFHIPDMLGIRFQCLLNDYIECLRTLGLLNEAQVLYERIVFLSVQSSRSSVSERPTVPSFNVPLKLSPQSTFPQITNHNIPSNCNAPSNKSFVNNAMPCYNKPNSLLKDNQPLNLPSTSAPYVKKTCGMDRVKEAIFTENLSQLVSLIVEYKDGDLTDKFLQTCLNAMQESAHHYAVFFRNLCQNVTVYQKEQHVKMDKSLECVLQTIGYNLIIYSTNKNEWKQAYNIYQTLLDLFNDTAIINVKMYMVDKPTHIERLLIICKIFVKNNDCRYAWELFKVNNLHTSRCWSDQRDIQYRNLVFTELMTGLNKKKQWETLFTIIEYIFKNNLNELDPLVDTSIQKAIKSICTAEYLVSFMSVCPVWYNRVHCYTFRMIVVKLVKDQMHRIAHTVYRQGCEMNIYPHLHGNEHCLVVSTHYVQEEVLLMLKVFLHNMVNYMPVTHTVVIRVRESAEVTDAAGTELPRMLQQDSASYKAMHVRIVNILNNCIKPPIRVVNRYSQLEIMPAELEKHLEARRKWNKFC